MDGENRAALNQDPGEDSPVFSSHCLREFAGRRAQDGTHSLEL